MPYKSIDSFFDLYQKKGSFSLLDNKYFVCKKFKYNMKFTTDRKRWHNKPLYHNGLLSTLDKSSITVIALFQMAVTVLTASVSLLFFPPVLVAKVVALCIAIGAFFLSAAYMVSNKKINTEFFTGWSCHKSRLLLDFIMHPDDIKNVAKKSLSFKEEIPYKKVRYQALRSPLFDNRLALPKSKNSENGENV